ncbi:MAG: hypothetical protein GXO88_07755 [Chlorobi bacterium]|nr:hypothetical protein [Chlorobiota bacterium]
MKKIIILFVSLIALNFSLLAQTNNISTVSVPNSSTAYGVNLPAGNQIYDFSSFKLYILKSPATKLQSINTSNVVLVTLNDSVAKNKADIATNAANVSTNTGNISTNAGNISTNTTNIAANTSRLKM